MNYKKITSMIFAAILFCGFGYLIAQADSPNTNPKTLRIEFNNYPEMKNLDESSQKVVQMLNRRMWHIMNISDIEMAKIDISGEIKYSAIRINEHYVRNGIDSVDSKLLAMSFEMIDGVFSYKDKIDSIFSFEVVTRKVDDVKQIFSLHFSGFSYKINYNRALADVPYYLRPIVILDTPNTADVWACLWGGYDVSLKSIPFIVFSPGQKIREGCWDICRVQGTGYHPSVWYEKFDIKDYIYLTIEFLAKEELEK